MMITPTARIRAYQSERPWQREFEAAVLLNAPPHAPAIERMLGLPVLVSLSEKPVATFPSEPIAIGFSAPFRHGLFHLGVHNLPAERAERIRTELAACSAAPRPELLRGILEWLHDHRGVLVVLHRPCNLANPADLVAAFLDQHGRWIHGLELHGSASRAENRRTLLLGSERGIPIVTGGGLAAARSGAVNLTATRSFGDFVQALRARGQSDILWLPGSSGAARPVSRRMALPALPPFASAGVLGRHEIVTGTR